MKKNAILLAAMALALPSFADTTIRMTGSTAFRSQTHTALVTATPAGLGFTQTAFTLASASGAKFAIYERGTSPNKITIKTSWTGSVGGIQAVAQQRTDVKYLPDVGTGGVVAGSGNAEALATETGPGTQPHIGFADNAQAATIFRPPFAPSLTDKVCGVVQFRWITNYNSPITSINSQQARAIFQSGSVPLSMFTGNPADSTKKVYGIGRDPDSGTRVICLAETGIGPLSTVTHWQPGLNTGTGKVDTLIPWPATTLFGINYAVGNAGYASGGDLVRAMRYDTTTVAVNGGAAEECYFVAMVGASDVSTALAAHNPPSTVGAGPAKVISYENGDGPALGSGASAVADIIKNGTYPCWSYLHCFHAGLANGSVELTFYNDLTALLEGSTSNNIKLSDMQVRRSVDGGVILPK